MQHHQHQLATCILLIQRLFSYGVVQNATLPRPADELRTAVQLSITASALVTKDLYLLHDIVQAQPVVGSPRVVVSELLQMI